MNYNILSIDIGIHNLGYSLFNINDNKLFFDLYDIDNNINNNINIVVSRTKIINEFIGIRFDMSAIRHVYASLTRMALDENAVIVQYPVIDPAQSSGTNLIVVDYAIQMVPIVPESYIEWGSITFR